MPSSFQSTPHRLNSPLLLPSYPNNPMTVRLPVPTSRYQMPGGLLSVASASPNWDTGALLHSPTVETQPSLPGLAPVPGPPVSPVTWVCVVLGVGATHLWYIGGFTVTMNRMADSVSHQLLQVLTFITSAPRGTVTSRCAFVCPCKEDLLQRAQVRVTQQRCIHSQLTTVTCQGCGSAIHTTGART